MKKKYSDRLQGRLGVRTYLFMSGFHWAPREKFITRALDELLKKARSREYRIVDIGCGPGLLVRSAEKTGCEYLGIDRNPYVIEYCKNLYSDKAGVTFRQDRLENESIRLTSKDIAVMNGVVHHLDDDQLDVLLERLSSCRALIIADHWKSGSASLSSAFVPSMLQKMDRGRFLRPYRYFENLPDYTLISSEIFPIRFAGLVCWTYFCNCYKPKTAQSR